MTSSELILIEIPAEFLDLCGDWAGGTDCMLRAINSTGGLDLGSIRPWNDDTEEYMTDREWHHHLYGCLSCDIYRIIASIERQGRESEFPDLDDLRAFQDWADETAAMLAKEYGIDA